MKSMFALMSFAFMLAACSNSNNDSGPARTPFQKASDGVWLSECQQDNQGFFKETLKLDGTNGTTTSQYFQNNNCTGTVIKTDGPTAFTYSSVGKAGGKDGEGTVTINVPGKPAVNVEVTVQGNTMMIQGPNGTVLYNRIGGGPGGNQGSPAMQAFDAVARGNWMSRDCKQINGGGGSYLQIITIQGNGNASTVYNVYADQQCQGQPNPQGNSNLTYTVNRFANGGGQITVNNQPIDVTINGAQMTLSSVNGTETYLKIQ